MMKKVFILISLFYCFKGFATDAGYAYRFFINIESNEGQKYSGYVYFYYDYEFRVYDDILAYLAKRGNRELTIYPHIITVNANRDTIDFALEGTKQKVSLDEIENIELIDCLNFKVGERIKELSKEQYKLIKTTKAMYSVIEDVSVYENIKYILLAWDENQELSKKKDMIAPKIMKKWKQFIDVKTPQSDTYNTFIKTLKKDLLKENIVLISFAEAL